MDKLRTLLIANRGEIAVRICKTAKKLGIRSIAIYTAADATSLHVTAADEAILLPRNDATAYTDAQKILDIARASNADAIIPGYGFLSENPKFAKDVIDAGMCFVGPSPEAIEAFGLKHRAREMAVEAGVPVVPGTQNLLDSEQEAVLAADELGYPVMLKATAGGGGMGLLICHDADEVAKSFDQVKSRGAALFKNSGVFIERYYPKSHHIEVQVFGNGMGDAIHLGERECSIQRRHQKVVEECPSPFVEQNIELREKLTLCAVALAESVNYGSAGTVEYLVDDITGSFFFLEMNTRLQVEHGITELCYNMDLVELMLQQADQQLLGNGGLSAKKLKSLQPTKPVGSALEVRVYAENPVLNYHPAPGLLQYINWKEPSGTRIDTWVTAGSRISTYYDPLIAKVMVHSAERNQTIGNMIEVLSQSKICGPPTNLDFLHAIVKSSKFLQGDTLTDFLDNFEFHPSAIEVVSPGVYTTVQDYPGRCRVGYGIPQSGPMDPLAFQIANYLVGNPGGTEGLEVTLKGPELRFWTLAVVAVCGAPIAVTIDGEQAPMWTQLLLKPGQVLSVGKLTTEGGCRAYVAVAGGFPAIADYYGSKSTAPLLGLGGYQGRALAPGDMLKIHVVDNSIWDKALSLPEHLRPEYANHWDIFAMAGPYDEGYILPDDIEMIYNTVWNVSHNATRGGIRLVGPAPRWARENGGDGGQHPANVIEYGYPLGTLNWTGETPCVFPVDAPDLGGFISSTTVVTGSLWHLGQVKSGDTIKYHRVSLDDALYLRKQQKTFLDDLSAFFAGRIDVTSVTPMKQLITAKSGAFLRGTKAVVHQTSINIAGSECLVTMRQGGDDFLLLEYGDGEFNLNHRRRVAALEAAIKDLGPSEAKVKENIYKLTSCCNSLLIHYDGSMLGQEDLVSILLRLQRNIGDQSQSKVLCRKFRLPICFESPDQEEATRRYMETQRPYAPFLPDNMEFLAKINGITRQELESIFLTTSFMAICVGFFCADTICLPIDPRCRLKCPKQNPSRVFTPEGSVSWGGSCMNIYPIDAPGGYQMTGQTIPCFDQLGTKPGFEPSKPGLFKPFDQITFYRVNIEEFQKDLALFKSGRYQFEFQEAAFDMAHYNHLLETTRVEVIEIQRRQKVAEASMLALEKESMEKWMAERAKASVPEEEIYKMQSDPSLTSVDAPLDANVWKVQVAAGDVITSEAAVVILEAMKMEISVYCGTNANPAGTRFRVERVLVQPGGMVRAGETLAFLKQE